MNDHPLSHDEYTAIYKRVPRLSVELALVPPPGLPPPGSRRCVLLAKRAIEPFIGTWHLPGGTVRFGESLEDAVRRVADRELGVEITGCAFTGVAIQYPSHVAAGLDSPVGLLFECWWRGALVRNHEASELAWWGSPPIDTHVDQRQIVTDLLARFR